MESHHIAIEPREFLALVTDAAFASPHSDEREQLDLKMAGISGRSHTGKSLDTVTSRVHNFISELEKGKQALASYPQKDQQIIQYTPHLFDVFLDVSAYDTKAISYNQPNHNQPRKSVIMSEKSLKTLPYLCV